MGDRVQRTLEDMVPELEEYQMTGIFTPEEVKHIVARRTDAEYRMRRRDPQKLDFLNCIEYELNLHRLRGKRKRKADIRRKLKSDFTCLKRANQAYERMTQKFAQDLELWLQYIDFCVQNDHLKVLENVFPKALQRHATEGRLWMRAAEIEFEHKNNMNTARVLCQRGLRFCPTEDMYVFFCKLEWNYIDKLIRRKRLLGLGKTEDEEDKSQSADDSWVNDASMLINTEADTVSLSDNDKQPKEAVVLDIDDKDKAFLSGAVPTAIFKNAISSTSPMRSNWEFRMKLLRLVPLNIQDVKSGIDLTPLLQLMLESIARDFEDVPEAWIAQATYVTELPLSIALRHPLTHVDEHAFECTTHLVTANGGQRKKRKTESASAPATACVSPHEMEALRVLDFAHHLEGGSMWEQIGVFLHARLMLHGTALREGDDASLVTCRAYVAFLIESLLRVCDGAAQDNALTEVLIEKWVTMLRQTGKAEKAEEVLSQGFVSFPKSIILWKLRLDMHTEIKTKDQLFRRALAVLSQDTAACSEVMSMFIQEQYERGQEAISLAQLRSLYQDAIALDPSRFKLDYVKMFFAAAQQFGDDSDLTQMRAVITDVLETAPRSPEVYNACLEAEPNVDRKIDIFERALREHGHTQVMLWLLYAKFLSTERKIKKLNHVAWRATQELHESLRATFQRQYLMFK